MGPLMLNLDVNLFILLLTILFVIYLVLGYRAATPIDTNEEYLLSGRSLGTLALTMTIVATQLGGGTILGSAEEAYRSGWSVLFYPLGSCLGLLFLASGFGAKLRNSKFSTISEVFESIYGSRGLRRLSSALSIISLFIILAAQGIAARKFLHSLGLTSPLFFLSCWAVIISYTVAGGLNAVVNTDVVQALFIISALVLTLFMGVGVDIIHFQPSWEATEQLLRADVPWTNWLLMPFCFMLIEQDIGQRLFAAKNQNVIRISCLWSCLIMLATTALPIALGNLGRQLEITAGQDSSILLATINVLCSPAVTSIFACAILMAILSTADSLLCSITSNITFDFPLSKRFDAHQKLKAAKIVTFIVGIASIGISYLFDDVLAVLIFSYELSVAILFVPVVLGFLWKGACKAAAIASCATSASIYAIGLVMAKTDYAVWACLIAGLIAFMIAQAIYGKARREI